MTKILVVDDDKNLLEVIKYNLINEGYTVIIAENGIQAVEIARQEKPDLIILDVMIPGIDGGGVTITARSTGSGSDEMVG